MLESEVAQLRKDKAHLEALLGRRVAAEEALSQKYLRVVYAYRQLEARLAVSSVALAAPDGLAAHGDEDPHNDPNASGEEGEQ